MSAAATTEPLVRAVNVTKAFGSRFTWTGASITFSSAVMCGNRLNRWNTMPIRDRCRAMSLSVRMCSLPPRSSIPISWPPTQIRPPVRVSIWLISRRKVVLPEPDGPSRQTTSRSSTVIGITVVVTPREARAPFRGSSWSAPLAVA